MEPNPPASGASSSANPSPAPPAPQSATSTKVVTMNPSPAVAPIAVVVAPTEQQQQKQLEQPPPEKKQRTAEPIDPNPPPTSTTPSPQSPQQHTTQLLLPDYPAIRQMVQDLLALLQTYGPLTLGQLEYNLPPVTNTNTSSQLQWSVKDILTILTSIQLVHERTATTTSAASTAADPQQPQSQPTVYYWNDGIPRINHLETASAVLQPPDIVPEIAAAVTEAEQAWERGNRLLALLQPTTTTTTTNHQPSHRDVLKQLLVEYPELVNDPVYLTAFRCCHIDVNTGKGSGGSKNPGSGKASKGGGKTAGAGNSKQSKAKAAATAAAPKPPPVVAPPAAAPSKPTAPTTTTPPPVPTTMTTIPAAQVPTTSTVVAAAAATPAQPSKTGGP